MNNYVFKINGMYCAACEIWLEDAIKQIKGVDRVSASLHGNTIKISSSLEEEVLRNEISKVLLNNGGKYSLGEKLQSDSSNKSSFFYPALIALIVISLFILIQRLNLVSLVNTGDINYIVIFLLGVVASLSTCAAIVGSLVLNISANIEKGDKKNTPLFFFHISRLVSFFALGGVLGLSGSLYNIGSFLENILRILVQVVMIFLALNLLGFDIFSKLLPKLPKVFSSKTFDISRKSGNISALLLGMLTFFLPCGFTQSMQLLALSSKSFLSGSLVMVVFALGTLPVLVGISKISKIFSKSKFKDIFFKTAGLIVLAFSVWEIYSLISLI